MVHLIVSNFHNRHAIHFEVQIFLRKLLRQLKHELRSCLKILLFKKKRRLLAGTSTMLNTLVKHLFQDSRGKVAHLQEIICQQYLSQR